MYIIHIQCIIFYAPDPSSYPTLRLADVITIDTTQWAKSAKKQPEGVRFLLIRHSKFCPLRMLS